MKGLFFEHDVETEMLALYVDPGADHERLVVGVANDIFVLLLGDSEPEVVFDEEAPESHVLVDDEDRRGLFGRTFDRDIVVVAVFGDDDVSHLRCSLQSMAVGAEVAVCGSVVEDDVEAENLAAEMDHPADRDGVTVTTLDDLVVLLLGDAEFEMVDGDDETSEGGEFVGDGEDFRFLGGTVHADSEIFAVIGDGDGFHTHTPFFCWCKKAIWPLSLNTFIK